MAMSYEEINIWCSQLVNGAGGIKAQHREVHHNRATLLDAVKFTVRALANPRCEGSDEVLKLIQKQRDKASR